MFLEIVILASALAIFVILVRKIPDIIARAKNKTNEEIRPASIKLTDQPRPVNLMQKADFMFKKGDFPQAERLYIQAAAEDPKNSKIYNRLGAIYLEQKNFHDAKEAFRETIRLDGQKASQHFNFALVCRELKEYRNAADALEKAVELDKKNKKYRQTLEDINKFLK